MTLSRAHIKQAKHLKQHKRKRSPVEQRVMCKCGCKGEASYIVESEDYEGRPFKEPCCLNATDYLRDGASELNKPYKETPCT